MYNHTLYNGLINIVPFWSSNLIQIIGIGNEYNIAFNMILTELLKITTSTLNDTILLFITLVIAIIIVGHKFGFNFNINFWTKNIIIITGKEIYNKSDFTIEYCDKILALNNYLLNKKNIINITYIDDIHIAINNLKNLQLTSQISLNIYRTQTKDDTVTKVSYELVSYTADIDKFINYIIKEYKKDLNTQIILIGSEDNKIISYPEPIHAINYFVNCNYKFPKLKCMKLTNEYDDNITKINATTNEQHEDKNKDKNKDKKNINYSYTLDNIINFDLEKVFLTISRDNNRVIYFIKSTKVNCKEWLDEIINNYNQNKNSPFKNKLVLTGREEILFRETSFKNYYYSKEMWAINWLLINKLNYQNYECVNGDIKTLMYKYVLEPLELFKIQDDLFLTLKKEHRFDIFNRKIDKGTCNNSADIIFILYSNTLNIKKVLETYVNEFDIYRNNIGTNKILYHFTYSGMKNDKNIFNSNILSEENTDRELFETFDNIYSEHNEILKKDIDKLKDLQYYKSHGLKRKKGYLFHGIPGCGKTSSVIAMALYDSRHIIEIPFSLLTTHQEFETILNMKSINNIEINNNNVIFLFDEIDIGMEKISSRDSNKKNSQNNDVSIISALLTYENDTTLKDTTKQKINLGSLLSKLDGIGNYNGLIIIGTTNHIETLDPALYRELRLTPIEFKQLRKEDSIKLINSYFGSDYNLSYNEIIKDRYFTPTKLITLCQKYDDKTPEYFFNIVLKDIIENNEIF